MKEVVQTKSWDLRGDIMAYGDAVGGDDRDHG
jgi:hypothetical protein